ncbi:MAG TPA: hypothetical protein DSN98_07775, partial [Thermoplasmata archaeon]
PTKKTLQVESADFLIAGIIGRFERNYKKAMDFTGPDEYQKVMGAQVNSAWYGPDAVKGFFDNIVQAAGKLYVKGHVGYTGSAYDGVCATATLTDQASGHLSTLKLEAAYQEELDYGSAGNRTGYQIINGARFTTALDGATGAADEFTILDSVAQVKIGDMIKIAAGTPVYRKVTGVDENARKVSFTGAVGSIIADNTAVTVLGFQIKTYRKSTTGIVAEVETDLGLVWCTMEPEVGDYYAPNVHAANSYLKVTDLASASLLNESFPQDVLTTAYLASGADGTTPTTYAHFAPDLLAFDGFPVRILCNPESTDAAVNAAGEAYCKARDDEPKWVYNIPMDRTKAQLLVIGNSYQRSSKVLGVTTANWLEVSDPFSSSPNAPARKVPNVGHIAGLWIYTISNFGIHYVPAVASAPIQGVIGVVGDTFLNDFDRTDIANAGINVIQFVKGAGYCVRSWVTPSTTTEFRFGNGIMMQGYFKVSVKDSLDGTLNEPNSMAKIRSSRDAVITFMHGIWQRGSTGYAPEGESFGQSENEDGSVTAFEDHVQVQADIFNNPQSSINLGNRNIDSWFTYPSPAGSIKIAVGFMLR